MQRGVSWQDASIKAAIEKIKRKRSNWITMEYESGGSRIVLGKTGRDYQDFINCFQDQTAMMGYIRHDNNALFVHYMSPDISERDRVYSMIHAKNCILEFFPVCSSNICIFTKADLSVDYIMRVLDNVSDSPGSESSSNQIDDLVSFASTAPSSKPLVRVKSSESVFWKSAPTLNSPQPIGETELFSNGFFDSALKLQSASDQLSSSSKAVIGSGVKATHSSGAIPSPVKRSDADFEMIDDQKKSMLHAKKDGDLKGENFWVGMNPQPAPNIRQGPQLNGSPCIMSKKAQFVLMGKPKKQSSLTKLAISTPPLTSSATESIESPLLSSNWNNSLGKNTSCSAPPNAIPFTPKLERQLSLEDEEKLISKHSKFSKRLKKQSTEIWVNHKAPADEIQCRRLLRLGVEFLSIFADETDPVPLYDIPLSIVLKASSVDNSENGSFGVVLATTFGVHIINSIDDKINFKDIIMAQTANKTPKYYL